MIRTAEPCDPAIRVESVIARLCLTSQFWQRGSSSSSKNRVWATPQRGGGSGETRFASGHDASRQGADLRPDRHADANRGTLPLAAALDEAADGASRREAEHRERRLLFVAATRARREVKVLVSSEPSPLLLVAADN